MSSLLSKDFERMNYFIVIKRNILILFNIMKSRDNIQGWKNLGIVEGISLRISTNCREYSKVSQAVKLIEVGTNYTRGSHLASEILFTQWTESYHSLNSPSQKSVICSLMSPYSHFLRNVYWINEFLIPLSAWPISYNQYLSSVVSNFLVSLNPIFFSLPLPLYPILSH